MSEGLEGVYDHGNVFARIIRGELPASKVWEDEAVLSFMDLFPQSRGHLLVLPKAPARNILDVEPKTLGSLMTGVQRTARAVREALGPDGITVSQFNGAAGGQTVFHLHFHIIPRWENQPIGRHGAGAADPEELRSLAAEIAARL